MERHTIPVPFGKYELLERIAIGGMAEVFRSRLVGEGGFEKQLVIKRILPHLSSDAEFVHMLIDEAKIAGCLYHPNIIQIYDLGKISGTYFIAMEYIEGGDLKAVTERSRTRGQALPLSHAVYIIMEVLKGLEYAHQKTIPSKTSQAVHLQIIHRDVSPPNILISYEGEVKIVDFGIAKAATRVMETSAGILKGKFEYMSPEQAAGLNVDARSDLFSTGIVLYELLTGTNPIQGQTDLEVLDNVRMARIQPIHQVNPDIPERLASIVMKALKRELDERYQHAGEMRNELMAFAYEEAQLCNASKLAAFMREHFEDEVREGRSASSSPAPTPQPIHPPRLAPSTPFSSLDAAKLTGMDSVEVDLEEAPRIRPHRGITEEQDPEHSEILHRSKHTIMAELESLPTQQIDPPPSLPSPSDTTRAAGDLSTDSAVHLLQEHLSPPALDEGDSNESSGATLPEGEIAVSFFHDAAPAARPSNAPSDDEIAPELSRYGFDVEEAVTTIDDVPKEVARGRPASLHRLVPPHANESASAHPPHAASAQAEPSDAPWGEKALSAREAPRLHQSNAEASGPPAQRDQEESNPRRHPPFVPFSGPGSSAGGRESATVATPDPICSPQEPPTRLLPEGLTDHTRGQGDPPPPAPVSSSQVRPPLSAPATEAEHPSPSPRRDAPAPIPFMAYLIGFLAGLIPGLIAAIWLSMYSDDGAPEPPRPLPTSQSPAVLTIHAQEGVTARLDHRELGSSYPLTLTLEPHRAHRLELVTPGGAAIDIPLQLKSNEHTTVILPAPKAAAPPLPKD